MKSRIFEKFAVRIVKKCDEHLPSLEIGAVQKNAHLEDIEKCCNMRLLSLSEASIQPRMRISFVRSENGW